MPAQIAPSIIARRTTRPTPSLVDVCIWCGEGDLVTPASPSPPAGRRALSVSARSRGFGLLNSIPSLEVLRSRRRTEERRGRKSLRARRLSPVAVIAPEYLQALPKSRRRSLHVRRQKSQGRGTALFGRAAHS